MKPTNRSQAQNLVHDNFLLDIQKSLINLPPFFWDKDPNTISFHVLQPDRQRGRDLVIHWGPSVVIANGLNETTRIFTSDNYKRLAMLANIELKTTTSISLLLDRTGQATREAFDNAKSYNNSGRYPFSIGIGAIIKNDSLVCSIITLDGANYRYTPRPVIIGTFYSEDELYSGLKKTVELLSSYLEHGLTDTKYINSQLDSLEPFFTTNSAHIDYNLLDFYDDLLPPEELPKTVCQGWPPSPPNEQRLESSPPASKEEKSIPPSGPIFEDIENEPYHKILRKAADDSRPTKGNIKFLNLIAPLITTEFKEFKRGSLSDDLDYGVKSIEANLDRLSLIGILKYEVVKNSSNKKAGYKIKLNEDYL